MESGGQSKDKSPSTSDLQRQTAAAIARRKVLESYNKHPDTTPPQPSDHLKDEPINPKINSESWKQYHSAWQNYYQKYYSTYYSAAAKNYVEKERLKNTRTKKSHHHLKKFIPLFAGLAVVLLILFLQYNRLIFAPIMAYVSPGDAPASEIEAIDPTITATVSDEDRLIIPKLNIDVPVSFGIELSDVMSAMNNGVAHYRIAGASAYPGEVGNTIITGHSAGDIYSSNQYKYIFSGLERLVAGDLIYVNYNSTRYTYSVTETKVVEPTDIDALILDTDKPMLTLITCTPLGTSRYRLLVFAEQISPAYTTDDSTSESASEPESTTDDSTLPSNEPSFFERIWNWLTGN